MAADTVYRALRAEIQGAKYEVGTVFPTEARLSEIHKVSRGTVRAALQRLADEGFLSTGQGRKRVVQRLRPLRLDKLRLASVHYPPGGPSEETPSFGGYLGALNLNPRDLVLRVPTRTTCAALAEDPRFEPVAQISEALDLKPEAEVVWFLRLRLIGDEPLALQWVVLPAGLVPDVPLARLVPGGLTALYKSHGIERHRVCTAYTPTRADRGEMDQLRLGPGTPLIEERRVSYRLHPQTQKPAPYEFLVTLYTERVALTFEWTDADQSVTKNSSSSR
jgi:DNA-binding GntR family transcriptional regulator